MGIAKPQAAYSDRKQTIVLRKAWVQWLVALVGVIVLGAGLSALLYFQGALRLSEVVAVLTAVSATGWLYWGLWCKRKIRWVKVAAAFIVSGTLVAGFTWLMNRMNAPGPAIAAQGIWTMSAAFVAGLWLIRQVLTPGYAIMGIARTLIDEAVRMKIALIFIIGLVLLVPVLPFILDPVERLQYRMQFFLTWSLSGASLLLSLMTVFLACGTICNEIQSKQIFMTMVKPVSRLEYLLGKWLGIALLNLVLVAVAGGGIYHFARLLASTQALSVADEHMVKNQIMVARSSVEPRPPAEMNFAQLLRDRLEQLKAEGEERYQEEISAKDEDAARKQIIAQWHTVPPRGSQTYVFHGLDAARQFGEVVQLRFKPKPGKTPQDEMVKLAVFLNGDPYPMYQGVQLPIKVAADNYHILNMPLSKLDKDGNMSVRLVNVNLENPEDTDISSVSFTPGEGLEVLYRVGNFEPNLIRGLVMIWIRLLYLAILGVTAGTFLGFPVASLLCLMVLFTAGASEFLSESLRYYAGYTKTDADAAWDVIVQWFSLFFKHLGEGKYWDATKLVIRLIGETFVYLIPSFSRYNPVPRIADGRHVPYELVGQALFRVGVIWGGICAVVAWIIFRKRELARVTV